MIAVSSIAVTEDSARDGTEGYAWDESLCAISAQRSQRFSIHLISSLLSITFFSKFISQVVLIITVAKTNQWRSIYSEGQSARAQGVGQRWCLHLDGRWLISLDEVPIRTTLQPHCFLPGALLSDNFRNGPSLNTVGFLLFEYKWIIKTIWDVF